MRIQLTWIHYVFGRIREDWFSFSSYGYHSGVSQLFVNDARETAALRGFLHDGARQRMQNEGPETAFKKLSLWGK